MLKIALKLHNLENLSKRTLPPTGDAAKRKTHRFYVRTRYHTYVRVRTREKKVFYGSLAIASYPRPCSLCRYASVRSRARRPLFFREARCPRTREMGTAFEVVRRIVDTWNKLALRFLLRGTLDGNVGTFGVFVRMTKWSLHFCPECSASTPMSFSSGPPALCLRPSSLHACVTARRETGQHPPYFFLPTLTRLRPPEPALAMRSLVITTRSWALPLDFRMVFSPKK